jgi:photosystem II stability/assembly factor-like uncharacterized protein
MLLQLYFGSAVQRNLCSALFLMVLWLPQLAGSADSNLSLALQVSNTKSTLMSIQFRTPQHGWAVGTGGTILRTTDGGKNWKRMTSGTSALLTSVFFVDSSKGWVTGAGGLLRHTVNGGESWSPQSLDTQQALYGISFASPNVGWAVGGGGTIFHTADGGQHWAEQISGTNAALYAAHFLNDQNGTIVGALGTVLSTDTRNPGGGHALRCCFHGYYDRLGRRQCRGLVSDDRRRSQVGRSDFAMR